MFPSFGLFAPSSAMLVVGSYVSVFSYSFFFSYALYRQTRDVLRPEI